MHFYRYTYIYGACEAYGETEDETERYAIKQMEVLEIEMRQKTRTPTMKIILSSSSSSCLYTVYHLLNTPFPIMLIRQESYVAVRPRSPSSKGCWVVSSLLVVYLSLFLLIHTSASLTPSFSIPPTE